MDKHIELKITGPATEVNVSSVDAEEVARIVQLAGIQRPPSTPVKLASVVGMPVTDAFGTTPAADTAGMSPVTDFNAEPMGMDAMPPLDADMAEPHDHGDMNFDSEPTDLGEQQSEYDFGDNPEEADGDEIPVNDYLYKAERLPQRIKGSNGDSGLLQEIHSNMMEKYRAFLAETDRENDDGVMSPLSDPTKPEFDKDPLSGETPVDDGSHSPMSTIVRQPYNK